MSDKYIALAAVLIWAAALTDLAAHRDENAARRFRKLTPEVYQSEADQKYNKVWHRIGLVQRVLAVAVGAVVAALWLHTWRAALGGAWAGGFLTAALFDVLFNGRIGNPLFYLGGTAKTDVLLAKFIPGATNGAGKLSFALETAAAVLGVIYWVIFV